jgi:hypothetical protein
MSAVDSHSQDHRLPGLALACIFGAVGPLVGTIPFAVYFMTGPQGGPVTWNMILFYGYLIGAPPALVSGAIVAMVWKPRSIRTHVLSCVAIGTAVTAAWSLCSMWTPWMVAAGAFASLVCAILTTKRVA